MFSPIPSGSSCLTITRHRCRNFRGLQLIFAGQQPRESCVATRLQISTNFYYLDFVLVNWTSPIHRSIPADLMKPFLSTTSPWKFSRKFSLFVQRGQNAGFISTVPSMQGLGEHHCCFVRFVVIGERLLYLYRCSGAHCQALVIVPHVLRLLHSGLPVPAVFHFR